MDDLFLAPLAMSRAWAMPNANVQRRMMALRKGNRA